MMQKSGQYLYVPYRKGGGIDAILLHLERIINIALSLGRIPILKEMKSSSQHRLDNRNEKVLINWDRYIDLSATKILKVKDGITEEVPEALQYVYQKDFDFGAYSEDQIRYIDKTQAHDQVNDQYPIICLLNSNDLKSLPEHPNIEKLNSRGPVHLLSNDLIFIAQMPSQAVNDITDIVLNHFGTTRESVQRLSNTLYALTKHRQGLYKKLCSKAAGCYVCMHVRYGRGSKHAMELLKDSNFLRESVSSVASEAYRRIDPGLPLYIMSNITQPDYFDFLKPKYNVYRYTDFEELRERFVDRKEIDHNLLYSVEKNIMRYAPIKIFSNAGNQLMFRGPWSNNSTGGFSKKQRGKDNFSIDSLVIYVNSI